jgi:hypothetical protein
MSVAQPSYLRVSCLRWLPRESKHFSDLTNPRLPFLRPGYHARCTSHGRKGLRHASSNAPNGTNKLTRNVTGSKRPEKTSSLLEELFPEEAQTKPQTSTRPKERNIPRLDVRNSMSKTPTRRKPERKNGDLVRRVRENAKDEVQEREPNWRNRSGPNMPEPNLAPDGQKRRRVEGVLMLRNASTTLVEDDFTRLIPQGLHIEGWALDQADIIKVVPGRNTSTLERASFYFILFNSRDAMNAYRSHVITLHSLASRHVQSSLSSPIPPPPGYQVNGLDVDSMLQTYTLVPPSRYLHLLPLPMRVTPSVADIVENQGYRDIVNGPLKEPYVVMIRLEGPQVPITMIKGALGKVERERRIPWNREFGILSYRTWEPKSTNISPLSRRPIMGKNERDNRFDALQEIAEMDNDADEEDDVEDPSRGSRDKRKGRCSYLFGFDSEDAALTFVQYWHRRPIDIGAAYDNDDIPPVVNAELLW